MIKLILCSDSKNGIGKNNNLPWKIKSEMEHFKNTTLHHIIVMGRKTFDSLKKPLPNRQNIILTKQNLTVDNAVVLNNFQEVLEIAKNKTVYIIGGKQIYNLFIVYADEIIWSKLKTAYDCDTFVDFNLTNFFLDKLIKGDEFDIYYYKRIKNEK